MLIHTRFTYPNGIFVDDTRIDELIRKELGLPTRATVPCRVTRDLIFIGIAICLKAGCKTVTEVLIQEYLKNNDINKPAEDLLKKYLCGEYTFKVSYPS